MKGVLQYSATAGSGYKNVGTERSIDNLSYTVKPVDSKNRIDEPEIVYYKVDLKTKLTMLDSGFNGAAIWHFRLYYPKELKRIYLGERQCLREYSGEIDRQKIEYHILNLKFNIRTDEHSDYTTPTL